MGKRRNNLSYRPRPPPPSTNVNKPSLTGSIVEGVASGITFGTGSAIGHRAIDSIMGPRKIEIGSSVPTQLPVNINDSCKIIKEQLNECMSNNNDCNEIFQIMKKMNCEF